MFQFHNGSIKRNLTDAVAFAGDMFQFHNGSIKSRKTSEPEHYTMEFQFHNGSIKSPNNQRKILYKIRAISTRRKLSLGSKVVNVRLCKIHGGLTTVRGYVSNP